MPAVAIAIERPGVERLAPAPEIPHGAGAAADAKGRAWMGPHVRPAIGEAPSRGRLRVLDPQALGAHVDRLYRSAWALCGDREDAEDLVQETFARVLSRPRMIRGEELAYLMKALRNTFLNTRRAASRRPVASAPLEEQAMADPVDRAQPEQALEAQEIYRAIAALPPDFRLAVVAVDMLGLSYREAARALGVGEATLTTRLFRARRAIVRELDGGDAPRGREAPAACGVNGQGGES